MKKDLKISRCGLACCLCSENNICKGCHKEGYLELSWCKNKDWCINRKCSIAKNINGCYECDISDCKKGLFENKIKPRAFNEFIKRFGMDELLNCLERNERKGIKYHRDGIIGDYDDFDDIEVLIDYIKEGK